MFVIFVDPTSVIQESQPSQSEVQSGAVIGDAKPEKAELSKPPPSATKPHMKGRKNDRRRRKKKIVFDQTVIMRAAGDESCDSSEMSELELLSEKNRTAVNQSEARGSSQSLDKVGLPVCWGRRWNLCLETFTYTQFISEYSWWIL